VFNRHLDLFSISKGQKAENEENCISKEKVQNQERGCGGMPLPDAAMGIVYALLSNELLNESTFFLLMLLHPLFSKVFQI